MRLYDVLMEQPGGDLDHIMLGGVSLFCKELAKAQCFQLSEEISFAAGDVCQTRPSTLLSAIDLIRAPYQHTWVEWTPSKRNHVRDNYHLFSREKPSPKRVGALTVTNKECTRGYMILAWQHHDDSLQVNPLGLIFNWDSADTEPVISQYLKAMYGNSAYTQEVIMKRVANLKMFDTPDKWKQYEKDDKEQKASQILIERGDIVPLEIFMPFLTAYNLKPGVEWYESFSDDLAGELPFVEAFYLLLNSKNSIVTQQREDLGKLNNARRKNKKPPLKEFINTRLRISKVVGNRAAASGLSREQARYHLVRGHFKVRKSGVYWWSSHPRGAGDRSTRQTYEVRA